MDYLSHALNALTTKLQSSDAFKEIPINDFRPYRNHLNYFLIHSACISVDRMPYFRIHNDAATKFYGFDDHDISDQNIGFYYRHFRLRQLPLIIQAHQFFNRDDRGEFRCTVGLKDHSGIYQEMTTAMQSVAWDQEGRPAYAVIVGAPVCDLSWYKAYEIFDLSLLSQRSLEAGRLMFCGHSNQEIADALDVSIKTVEKDLHPIFEKSATKARNELFALVDEFQLT